MVMMILITTKHLSYVLQVLDIYWLVIFPATLEIGTIIITHFTGAQYREAG